MRNAKVLPADFVDFDMTPECSEGYQMVYWGQDEKHNKFSCPHAKGNINCCHSQSRYSRSDYELVVKTKLSDNYRGISLPHWSSKRWQKLYN